MGEEKDMNIKNLISVALIVILFFVIIALPWFIVYKENNFNESIKSQIKSEPVDFIKEGRITYILVNNEMKVIDVGSPKFNRKEFNSSESFMLSVKNQPVYSFIEVDPYGKYYSSLSKTYVSFAPNQSEVYVYKDTYIHKDYIIYKYDEGNIYWSSNNGWLTLFITVIVFCGDVILCSLLINAAYKKFIKN
jgi:hypothetical protein